ncbi:MAG: carboxylesterase family protein [Solobacterium sp.]|jgi:para-nitrobenzyl esterase|nr:carboxylesterase family protein [Solobacterium sp.]MCH4221754.1 carboxylesterase family protein [Solobacterium sp.]
MLKQVVKGIILVSAAGAAVAAAMKMKQNSDDEQKRAAAPIDSENHVHTEYGDIEGVDEGSHIEYRGIPYAKAPINDLRWKAPQRMDRWGGTLQADEFSAREPQSFIDEQQKQPVAEGQINYHKEFYSDPSYERRDSEDCLYLNVYVPKNAAGRKLPVAFWIHGGAFNHGHGSEIAFDGESYAEKGVILVTINYRVGIFGFFAHPWLTSEDEHHSSGNYGILDQLAALQWVKENIAAFGGDPENITIFGQSAGAMSVQTIIESDLNEHIPAKAIMQSGCGISSDLTLAKAEEYGELFVRLTGAASLEALRALSTEELMSYVPEYLKQMNERGSMLCWQPVIDGYVLKEGSSELLKAGKFLDIPYMVGTTKNDITTTKDSIEHHLPSPLDTAALSFSTNLEELGRKPAYLYRFERDLPGDSCGAWHSSELWYMFGSLRKCWRKFEQHDYHLSEEMVSYWTNFMKNGDPNGSGLPEWKPSSKEEPVHILK